ncbi:MAG: 2-phosphosulfolactate phosphatase [Gammaproteobacteria bacterium]|nr:2-phosphosulfolactate phosphatase [Gammaproteobacteria bacterium]MBU1927267.1 2-phosphosulfolactate phosphatase [Gammaproteobacteria bacterium]
MNIKILRGIEGAKKATGLVVVIDVFRAFSTACYVFNRGAEQIIPVGNIELAYQIKKENPNFILMGERHGWIQPGFEFGNSPFRIKDFDFTGKTIVHTTSAGTQGIANAINAEEIVTGSFVNVEAVISYIRFRNSQDVSLVCTKKADEPVLDEDAVCAHYIKDALTGHSQDFNDIVDHLKREGFAKHFFDPERDSHPAEDFDLCLALNKFSFILKADSYRDHLVCLRKIESKAFAD